MLDTAVTTLLNVDKVTQVFTTGSGESRKPVLEGVSMSLKAGEIVALLGGRDAASPRCFASSRG